MFFEFLDYGLELELDAGPRRGEEDVLPHRARLKDRARLRVELVDGIRIRVQGAHCAQTFDLFWLNQQLVLPIFPCY